MVFWPIVIFVIVIASALYSSVALPVDPADEDAVMRLAYSGLLALGVIAAAMGRTILHNGWRTVHYGFVWSCVFAGMLVSFSFRDDLQGAVAALQGSPMPSIAMSQLRTEAELRRGWDGHYRADAIVNGVGMRLMVDTGASLVLIPYEQAAALGIDTESIDFSTPVMTANGRSTVAMVRIASIRVDDIVVEDVQAAVAQPGKLQTGLLGMTFLDKLDETSFQGERLFLRRSAVR